MMPEPFSVQKNCALMMKTVPAGEYDMISGFSLRKSGTSRPPFSSLNLGLHVADDPVRVLENRRILAGQIGFPLESWVCAEQVHGTETARVSRQYAGSGAGQSETAVAGVDGLYTTEPGLLLALCFADCVPVYFYTTKVPVVGLLHAGWRGTVQEGASRMLEAWMHDFAVDPADIHVVIGPAIDGADYEVDERVISEVRRLGESVWRGSVIPHRRDHYLLDLRKLNRAILVHAGVPADQISISGYDTVRQPECFFSYRRDGGSTGRMMGFIGMKENK